MYVELWVQTGSKQTQLSSASCNSHRLQKAGAGFRVFIKEHVDCRLACLFSVLASCWWWEEQFAISRLKDCNYSQRRQPRQHPVSSFVLASVTAMWQPLMAYLHRPGDSDWRVELICFQIHSQTRLFQGATGCFLLYLVLFFFRYAQLLCMGSGTPQRGNVSTLLISGGKQHPET